ncbi:MAG: POTRA domain-containing protein [Thermoguttaceae bacterium]|jgi:outer membrane protein insertion porin family
MAAPPVDSGFCRIFLCALVVLSLAAAGSAPGQAPPPVGLIEGPLLDPRTVTPLIKPTEEMVVEVRVEGNHTVKLEKILPHIYTRAGRPYDKDVVQEDVRRLSKTRWFVNVQAFFRQAPGGRVVIFQVLEHPILQEIKIIGNDRMRTSVLKEKTELKVGDGADPFRAEEARRKIEEFYQEKGYSKVRVTILEGNKPGDLRAIFLINEGPKQKIWKVNFVGNTIVSGDRLQTQIKSRHPYFYVFKGEVDRKQIEEDVKILTDYYRSLGFFHARVGRELEFYPAQDWATLTFVIDEGPRYMVNDIAFVGNTKFSSEQLREKLKLKPGEFFNRAKMQADSTAVQDKYGSKGYVFADVKVENRFLDQPGKLDLVFNVTEGDRYKVGRINIEIKGDNPHTRMTTVLNRLSIKPGDIVDTRELRASERRLAASGLFMNDRAKGAVPKIVFSPPELEDKEKERGKETGLAERPNAAPSYRGQSPDPPNVAYWTVPAAPDGGGQRVVDIYVQVQCPDETDDLPPPPTGYEDLRQPTGPSCPVPPCVYRGQLTRDGAAWAAESASPPYQPQYPLQQQYPVQQQYPAQPQYPQPQYPIQQPYQQQPYVPQYPQPTLAPPPPGGYSAPAPYAVYPPQGRSPGPGDVAPLLIPSPQEEPLRELPLTIRTDEAPTGRLMLGVGVNSDAGLVGSIVLDEQNFDWTRFPTSWEEIRNATAFRGAGERFRIEAVPGTQVQRYMVSFQEPYLYDQPVALGLSAFYYDRIYNEWTEGREGGQISLGYQFTHDLTGSVAFRGANVNISNPITPTPVDLARVVGNNALYGFKASLAHDTRDNAFLATEGHLFDISFEQVVGTWVYPHVDLDFSQYFKLYERPDGSGRHVLSLSARMGVSGGNTPIYERYYAGGFSSLRGFNFRGVSPIDPDTGVRIGGDFQLLGSIQYLFPITADDMLRGVVFCDAGTVEPSIHEWSQNMRVAPGFGLRIAIPAMGPAPIALDFAFPVTYQPGDEKQVFSFFVGFNR